MHKHSFLLIIWLIFSITAPRAVAAADPLFPALDTQQLAWLGEQIYRNECNSQPACLIAWNEGEDFPSLGIGHFIWYRSGQQERFVETFPSLLAFMALSGVALPPWLVASQAQPWPDRASFLAARDEGKLVELGHLLASTHDLQTAFIVERFSQFMIQPTGALAQNPMLAAKLASVANTQIPYGLYALIDYVHFKGEGTSTTERYADMGWGLLQVLEHMPPQSQQPLQDFVASAKTVLNLRVANSPVARDEQRWLAGWLRRVDTYVPMAAP